MRLRSRDLFSTNPLGASTSYAIGQTVEHDGRRWRITRHRVVPTTPWATIHVYGKPCRYPSVTDEPTVCPTCGGLGWIVIDRTWGQPEGEQVQCPDDYCDLYAAPPRKRRWWERSPEARAAFDFNIRHGDGEPS